MNSQSKKPGKPGVPIGELLFWENEWYWIFHGLAFGVPSTASLFKDTRGRSLWEWEPLAGPELFAWKPARERPAGFEKLDTARLKTWDSTPEGEKWKQVKRWINEPGIPPEPRIWARVKSAESAGEVRAACEASIFWLNPNRRPYTTKLTEEAEQFLGAKRYRYPSSGRPSSEQKRVLHFAWAMAGIMEGISAVRAIDLIRGVPCSCDRCENRRLEKTRGSVTGPTGDEASMTFEHGTGRRR